MAVQTLRNKEFEKREIESSLSAGWQKYMLTALDAMSFA